MALIHSIFSWVMKKRIHQMELFVKYPFDVQEEVFRNLIDSAKSTEWGKKYDYKSIKSVKEYQERVPISRYEDIFPFIDRMMHGERNILWPSKIDWFAKSSGTTNARSKFIPVSPESLEDCHYKAGKDMLSLYVNNFPNYNLFSGKTISIGGTHKAFEGNPSVSYGDVSAVIMENLPLWAQVIRSPSLKVALMDEWEEKLNRMVEETMQQNITSFTGVPTWTLVLLQRVMDKKGVDNILDVWPELELFVHGAVAFDPYRETFKKLIPTSKMSYMETYTASEGFFGIQDIPDVHEMLLMLDYGIFYEFVPMDQWGSENPKALTLEEVELNKNYAVIISTNAGLWRYVLGDTVRFTNLSPFRIKISGRTKHFINAFGEELIMENANEAIAYACKMTNSEVEEFTAAPIYFVGTEKGGHEWIIEFRKIPEDQEHFNYLLDKKLREVNSDYDAKRYKSIALDKPLIHVVPKDTFYKWMESRGKLGGQNKVPRLANNREYLDDIKKKFGI